MSILFALFREYGDVIFSIGAYYHLKQSNHQNTLYIPAPRKSKGNG